MRKYYPNYSIGTDAYADIPMVCEKYGTKAVIIGGTHACPASLVSLREFRFSSAGWCGSGVRIAPTLWVLSGGYNKDMYCVYLQIRWRYGKLDVAALRLVFLVLPQAMAISTSFLLFRFIIII